jgi:hypothetical protein
VNSGSIERMLIDGEFLPFSQSGMFDIHTWHDFVVHGVWTDQPTCYLESAEDSSGLGLPVVPASRNHRGPAAKAARSGGRS